MNYETSQRHAMKPLPDLQKGDALLYSPSSFFGWLIAAKTFNRCSHIELYAGAGISFASRDGKGVGSYPFRRPKLMHVMRPRPWLNWQSGEDWFYRTADGQKYDWKALLVFLMLSGKGEDGRMICSEFAVNFYRACGFEPFQPDYPADKVPPSYFLSAATFEEVWKDQ